jgi:hypothetical protein
VRSALISGSSMFHTVDAPPSEPPAQQAPASGDGIWRTPGTTPGTWPTVGRASTRHVRVSSSELPWFRLSEPTAVPVRRPGAPARIGTLRRWSARAGQLWAASPILQPPVAAPQIDGVTYVRHRQRRPISTAHEHAYPSSARWRSCLGAQHLAPAMATRA